jgi:hypothetical protein
VSRRLPRLSLRFVVAAALLGCLVSALPFRGQVHAATQPQVSGVIPSNQHLALGNGTFAGPPGTAIAVGPNGVITVSGATAPVQVTPNNGYVLARFNPTTGQWEAVPNNTIPPGTGATYGLISGQPVTIPSGGQLTLANGTVTGPPGTAVTVGPNGVISMSGATGPVQVSPNSGYVLAAYNTTTRQWEAVPNNTMLPGPGSYTLIPANSVPHISSLRAQLRRVSGGRTAACKTPRNAKGAVPSGCQIVNITAPARSRLSITVRYAGTRKTQRFVVTADAQGRYRGAFPVQYNPPARNKRGVTVTVTVVSTLPDGAYGGKKTIKFVATPRPARSKRH